MQILVTGGCGFIGSHLAARAITSGYKVTVLDNLFRAGTKSNLSRLKSLGEIEFVQADIRNAAEIYNLFSSKQYDVVFHQAAQVAVTSSLQDPRADFEINAIGTLNLLEAIRAGRQNPVFIFASTNKVYGSLSRFGVREQVGRYVLEDVPDGVSESAHLEFYSPYGCSKGASDQYVVDYRRIFGLRTLTFRQSCIYGPGQMGTEDQGWVAWFAIASLKGRPITIYGDGKQVRDLLYIDDLVELYFRAMEREASLKTFVFNVGGGADYSCSVLEVVGLLEETLGKSIEVRFENWRPGDQKVYISDTRAACHAFEWKPRISPQRGIPLLLSWIGEHSNVDF